MRRLSLYARERIVSLLSTNTSVVGITKSLNEEGIKASRSAVNLFICRFRKTEILHDVAFIIIYAETTAFKFSLKALSHYCVSYKRMSAYEKYHSYAGIR